MRTRPSKQKSPAPNGSPKPKSYWIQLGLKKGDVKALIWLSRRHFPKCRNVAVAAAWVLKMALARPDTVSAWFDQLVKYCVAEDVPKGEFLSKLIANHNGVKRTKFKWSP